MSMSAAAQDESRELTEHHLDEPIPTSALDGARIAWPKDKTYWYVFFALVAITAVEVSTYTHPDVWGDFATGSLLLMMAVKFWVVTWFFMHLRNDSKLLTYIFYFGLLLAVAVYCAAMATFRYFA